MGTRTPGSVGGSRKRSGPKDRHRASGLPNHVIKLSTDALDEIRRDVWNDARKAGQAGSRKRAQGRPLRAVEEPRAADRTPAARSSRACSRSTSDLYRAYLSPSSCGMIYRVPVEQALELLDAWLKWARRCRLEPFIKLAKTITKQRPGIEAALRHRPLERVSFILHLLVRLWW